MPAASFSVLYRRMLASVLFWRVPPKNQERNLYAFLRKNFVRIFLRKSLSRFFKKKFVAVFLRKKFVAVF